MSKEREERLKKLDAEFTTTAQEKAKIAPSTQYNFAGAPIVESKLISTSPKISNDQWKKLKKLLNLT